MMGRTVVEPDRFPPAEASPIRRSLALLCSFLGATALACQAGSELTAPSSPDPADGIVGAYESPFRLDGRRIAPANHLGPAKLEIVPVDSHTELEFSAPFGNNVNFGFTGFVYRNVAPFSLVPGDVIAFDLRGLATSAMRHNIYFATASANPQACGQVVSASTGWTSVVTQTQTPQNPLGDTITGNFELRYTAEAPFVFPGGGLLVGFETSPPAAIAHAGIAPFPWTTCTDPDDRFHGRFFFLPNLTTGPLTGDQTGIGGIAILTPGGPSTCAEGVSAARSLIGQLIPDRPFLRALLNFLLTRMQAGFPNAERNFGLLLDLMAQLGLITPQEASELQSLVAPC
jgi:hypothetical protein